MRSHRNENLLTTTKSSAHLQLEKAHTQQWRPSTAKINKYNLKIHTYKQSKKERTKDKETAKHKDSMINDQEIWKNKNPLLLRDGLDQLGKKW